MRKYIMVMISSIKVHCAYKTNIFFNVLAMLTKVLLAYILWGAIYESTLLVGNYSFEQMVLYYIICTVILQLDKTSSISSIMAEEIQEGRFAKNIILPVGLKKYYFFYSLGESLLGALIALLCCGGLVLALGLELLIAISISQVLHVIVMIAISTLIMAEINFMIGLLAIKYYDITIFVLVKDNLLSLITGSLLPLSLFPNSLQALMKFFPFYYMGYYPTNVIITGNTESIYIAYCVLLTWLLILHFVSNVLYRKLIILNEGAGL